MNLVKVLTIILFISSLSLFIGDMGSKSYAGNEKWEEKHLILFLVPGLSMEELDWYQSYTNYPQLWGSGAYAAVNLKPEGSYSYLNNTVSLSSGKRALGVKDWNAFEKGESWNDVPVEELFNRWYGSSSTSNILHPLISGLIAKNEDSSFNATIGWLGSLLQEEGVSTAVFGNSDLDMEKIRYGSLFVMNDAGEADGLLTGVVEERPGEPGGWEMSGEKLIHEVKQFQNKHEASFTVIEWGDIHRLFSEKDKMIPSHFDNQYRATLKRLEITLQDLISGTDADIWLLSPSVHSEAYQRKNQLGPFWIWEEKFTWQGKINSETTRRESLISNADIAPSIVSFFDINTPMDKVSGKAIIVGETDKWSYSQFKRRIDEVNKVFRNRGAVLSSYISGLVAMLVMVSLVFWLFERKRKARRLADTLLLSGVLSPFCFLVTSPIILPFSSLGYVILIMFSSVGTALILKKLIKETYSFACFLFFITLLIDIVFFASYLTERSFLSYDPVIGARYYGIGNEYAGIFIVSGILMTAFWLKNSITNKWLSWWSLFAVLSFTLVILGGSSYGANAGASLSTGVAIVFVFILYMKRMNTILKIIIMTLSVVLLFVILYLLQLTNQNSHIAIGFQHLLGGDWETIFEIIKRKIQMNWKIFKVSYWTQLFITSYFLIGVILWKHRKGYLMHFQNVLINCCIVTSLALLLLNDSGIVAAATSMFITLCVCYGWSLDKRRG
ncbi:hypothetical protein [Evansella tamaricis]|uniref:Phosphoglyceromutase n=1 Tax=Evansella tamaricis TaxID=2069301 RepID=A0ABS6JM90_9BACI|nr:hypothetical protein [Evansella tamaricis]MBU9713540.1 hypothetical protein [Evansella tamaricis]